MKENEMILKPAQSALLLVIGLVVSSAFAEEVKRTQASETEAQARSSPANDDEKPGMNVGVFKFEVGRQRRYGGAGIRTGTINRINLGGVDAKTEHADSVADEVLNELEAQGSEGRPAE